jgi:outer membrane protein assembly factor BamA
MGLAFVLATLLLGQVKVDTKATGLPRTQAATVVTLAKLDPGAPITFEKIRRAERELRSTNLFKDVHVTLLMPLEQAARLMYGDATSTAYADVEITLEEKRFWYAFPYGSFQPDNLSFGGVYANVNVAGRANTFFSAGEYGSRTKQIYLLFRDPAAFDSAFLGYDVDGLVRADRTPVYVDRQAVDQVAVTQGGGSLTLRLHWHPEFMTLFQYSLDHLDVSHNMTVSGPPYGIVNLKSGVDSDLRGELRYDGRALEEGLYHGALTRLWVEFSDDRIGSDYSYTREMMIVAGYANVYHVNLSSRAQLGVEYATGPGGIPFTKQYTLGGTDLRGYLKREFRGDTLASVQNEAIFPLFQVWKLKLRGDLFYDAGLVYQRADTFRREDFRQGVGGGIRVYFKALAIPVVGVDVAYGLEERAIGYYLTFGLPES